MITVKTNLRQVTSVIRGRMDKLSEPALLRPVALAMITPMAIRIHKNGIGSNGSQIGKYKKGYLALREKKYGRPGDPKIIVSLTRQLENDYAAIATGRGYGIGFNNAFNFDKSQNVQLHLGKKIFDLTTQEHETAVDLIDEVVNKTIQS